MKPILFLDIDGVLNGHQFSPDAQSNVICPACVMVFNRVLRAVEFDIVISSAWRYMIHGGALSLKGFEYMLRTHGVGPIEGRVVGCTVPDEIVPSRGGQIAEWMRRNRAGLMVQYAVLDDLRLDIEDSGHPLVLTEGRRGIRHDEAVRVAELLGGKLED